MTQAPPASSVERDDLRLLRNTVLPDLQYLLRSEVEQRELDSADCDLLLLEFITDAYEDLQTHVTELVQSEDATIYPRLLPMLQALVSRVWEWHSSIREALPLPQSSEIIRCIRRTSWLVVLKVSLLYKQLETSIRFNNKYGKWPIELTKRALDYGYVRLLNASLLPMVRNKHARCAGRYVRKLMRSLGLDVGRDWQLRPETPVAQHGRVVLRCCTVGVHRECGSLLTGALPAVRPVDDG